MRRFAAGLGLLAMAAACGGESGCRGSLASLFKATHHQAKPAPLTTLEAKYGQSLRVSHKHALGDIRGHRWSEDESLLAVWSEGAVVVFQTQQQRELSRMLAPAGRQIRGAGFSPDGRWVGVASHATDSPSSNLDLYAIGTVATTKRLVSVSGGDEDSWQFGRDNQTITWLELTNPGAKSGLRLHVDRIEGDGSLLCIDLPEVQSEDARGVEVGKSGKVILVHRADRVSLVEVATDHAWHYPAVAVPSFAPSGEAAAWANAEGFVLWKLGREQLVALSNPRCAPRDWPERAAARALFSEDERTVATSGFSGVCLWDAETGHLQAVLQRRGEGRESEFPKWPSGWVLSGKGLVVDGAELWDVERRKLVKSGFTEWSRSGSRMLLLEVANEVGVPNRLSSVDEQMQVHEVAREDCLLDLTGGAPVLLGLETSAAIACQPNPWIVDLKTSTSTRLQQPSGSALSVSPRSSHLTIATRGGFVLVDPRQPGSSRALVRDLGIGNLGGFDGQRLWLFDATEWQQFKWTTVDFGSGNGPGVTTGTARKACASGDNYSVGAHYLWSHPDTSPLVLCELTTGQQLGRLDNAPGARVLALNADATIAHVGGPRASQRLWLIGENKTTDLGFDLHQSSFAGPHTVVGEADGKVVVIDALTGQKSVRWEVSILKGESLVAADLASDLAVIRGTPPTLRRLGDGKVVAELPISALRSAVFGPNSWLFVSDNQRLWFWQLPATEPKGELVLDAGALLFVGANGGFDTSSPLANWQQSLHCAVGPETVNLEVCTEHLYQPGLMARVFSSAHDSSGQTH